MYTFSVDERENYFKHLQNTAINEQLKKNYPLLYSHISQEYSMVLIDGNLRPQFSWFFFFLNTNAYVTSL